MNGRIPSSTPSIGRSWEFPLCLSLVVTIIWSRRNYDFRHLAAEKVLESMGDGAIALDDHNRGENIRAVEGFREEMLNKDICPMRYGLP